jgi:hypothetical protein
MPFFVVIGFPFKTYDQKVLVTPCPLAKGSWLLPAKMQGATGSITPHLGLVLGDQIKPKIFHGLTSIIFSSWESIYYPNHLFILSLKSYQ